MALILGVIGCAYLPGADPSPAAPAQPPAGAPDDTADEGQEREQPAAPGPDDDLTPAERDQIRSLLARADRAIAEDHLTYPAQGSALALYDQIAILDPDNQAMKRGLERIVERYLELALQAAERERFTRAHAMLDRSRLVDPDHPGIAPTQAQVRMLAEADRHVIALDAEKLRHQDPELAATLAQAGNASRGDGCRAEIIAPSDAHGRWIYQQMSRTGGERIQAQLTIGSPPRIEVLCFPGSS